jgi:DNA primase
MKNKSKASGDAHEPLPGGFHERATRARQAISIEEVIGRYVELEQVGCTFVGFCPFDSDNAPVFVVSPLSQTFYCFRCQESGDAISFLARILRLSRAQALDALENLALNHE